MEIKADFMPQRPRQSHCARIAGDNLGVAGRRPRDQRSRPGIAIQALGRCKARH